LYLNLRKKLVKCYIWGIALYDAETRTFLKVDQKYLECSEMWCWRRVEKISMANHVKNEEALQRVKGRGISYIQYKGRKANWIYQILRRKCLLKYVNEVYIGRRI